MNLPFNYTKTKSHYVQYHNGETWEQGHLQQKENLEINPMSTSLQYGQEAFEGLKAYRGKDGRVRLFRIEENAKRFIRSVTFLHMPAPTVDMFMEAVKQTVFDNIDYVPPYDSGGTLYIRPYMIGIGGQLPPAPSKHYLFGVVVMPVGQLFEPLKPISLKVTHFDRAAPNGTGSYKVGGNYAASMHAQNEAKNAGYNDCLFLDPRTHEHIEEVGVANFFGITNDNVYVTPESPSILKGITNLSLQYIAAEEFNMDVIKRPVPIKELKTFKEVGACGTAAVITPIEKIATDEQTLTYPKATNQNSITARLHNRLKNIQFGDETPPKGWITFVN